MAARRAAKLANRRGARQSRREHRHWGYAGRPGRERIHGFAGTIRGTCQPDSDRSLKINVDFVAVSLAADSVGKFTTL